MSALMHYIKTFLFLFYFIYILDYNLFSQLNCKLQKLCNIFVFKI